MCRHNQLWASIMIAFGVGLLIGLWLNGGFFSHCFGLIMIFCGCGVFRRR